MEQQSRSKVYKGDGSPASSAVASASPKPEHELQQASDPVTQSPDAVAVQDADQQFEKATTALKSIDDELAEGGDQLLESAFASVEDLLGENLVANAKATEDAGELIPPSEAGSDQRADDVLDESPEEEPSALREANQAEPEPPHGTRHVKQDEPIAATDGGTIGDEAADSEGERAISTASPEATSPLTKAAAAVPHESLEKSEKQRSRTKRAGTSDMLRRCLALPSLPLQFIPAPWRPLVNWIAISLVLWVPIVWVVALVLR